MRTFDIMEQFRKLEEMMNEFDQETGEFIYSTESLVYFVKELEEKRELKLNNIDESLEKFTKKTIEWDKTKIKDAIKLGEDLSSFGIGILKKSSLAVR